MNEIQAYEGTFGMSTAAFAIRLRKEPKSESWNQSQRDGHASSAR